MDATKALIRYMQLRDRRFRLAHNPSDTVKVKYERFTEMEAEELRVAEAQLNRLPGARAVELLIACHGNVASLIR